MSILKSIFGKGKGGSVVDAIGDIVDDVHTSKEEEAELQLKQYRAETDRMHIEQQVDLAQIDVNKEQAKHPSLFVAGSRPFGLWVGGAYLAVFLVIIPTGIAAVALYLFANGWQPSSIESQHTWIIELLYGGSMYPFHILAIGIVCGMYGLRYKEKLKGIARVHWS